MQTQTALNYFRGIALVGMVSDTQTAKQITPVIYIFSQPIYLLWPQVVPKTSIILSPELVFLAFHPGSRVEGYEIDYPLIVFSTKSLQHANVSLMVEYIHS
jgi:hypothetical protein